MMKLAENDEPTRSEFEIIKSVTNGNRDDFRHLVSAYQNRVFAMVMRQVGDRNVALELSQDVFTRAYVSLPKFRFNARFSTWITRIALNVTNSYFSSRRYKEQRRTVTSEHSSFSNIAAAETDCTDDENRLHRLRQLIGTLKPIYRDVVVLCCLENRRYEDAATILQVPTGTVASRMNKAFRVLRDGFFAAE